MPISLKLDFFAMQNFESKLFPGTPRTAPETELNNMLNFHDFYIRLFGWLVLHWQFDSSPRRNIPMLGCQVG